MSHGVRSRDHGCAVFFSSFLCSHARLCEHRDMHMRVMHITFRLHTSSPLRNVLCVYSMRACLFALKFVIIEDAFVIL